MFLLPFSDLNRSIINMTKNSAPSHMSRRKLEYILIPGATTTLNMHKSLDWCCRSYSPCRNRPTLIGCGLNFNLHICMQIRSLLIGSTTSLWHGLSVCRSVCLSVIISEKGAVTFHFHAPIGSLVAVISDLSLYHDGCRHVVTWYYHVFCMYINLILPSSL